VTSTDSETILTIHLGTETGSGQARLRVLITGAGAGIGLACARAFAEQGAELILSDIDGPALKQAASRFGALGRFCDVASEASVAVFTAEVLKSYPSLDVLINAAGKSYVRNLGTMRITRSFLPMMKGDGGKKDIVNIAPMGGFISDTCPFPYAASREAFDRLTEALVENVRGTKVALTTIVPRVPPTEHEQGGSSANAVAHVHGTNSRQLESFDPDRVAAAVVAAVRSNATRPGKTTLLTAQVISQFPDRWQTAISCEPRMRKRGN
jgi:NADP-dependent 3-hydroxy acid dehydrogenase YdfG